MIKHTARLEMIPYKRTANSYKLLFLLNFLQSLSKFLQLQFLYILMTRTGMERKQRKHLGDNFLKQNTTG